MESDSKSKIKSLLKSNKPSKSKHISKGAKLAKSSASEADEVSTQQSVDDLNHELKNPIVMHAAPVILEEEKALDASDLFMVPHDSEQYKDTHYFK